MLLQLFDAWDSAGTFEAMKAAVLPPLGLAPERDADGAGESVRAFVVNLDDRPTGGKSGLLSEILPLLDPSDGSGIFSGAQRCATCAVKDWCPVMANAVIASDVAKDTIVELVSAAALEKGRHDSPPAQCGIGCHASWPRRSHSRLTRTRARRLPEPRGTATKRGD